MSVEQLALDLNLARRCRNGHRVGQDGVCSWERAFRKAADARGLDVDAVREFGWIDADRQARRAQYAQ